jgi:hypothetical protein
MPPQAAFVLLPRFRHLTQATRRLGRLLYRPPPRFGCIEMQRTIFMSALVLVLLVQCCAAETKTVTIIHTSDIHGWIDGHPVSPVVLSS